MGSQGEEVNINNTYGSNIPNIFCRYVAKFDNTFKPIFQLRFCNNNRVGNAPGSHIILGRAHSIRVPNNYLEIHRHEETPLIILQNTYVLKLQLFPFLAFALSNK